MLALVLAKLTLDILAAKVGGKADEVATIPGLIIKLVVATNQLSVEETGKPIDWNSLQEHHHFSGGGDPE